MRMYKVLIVEDEDIIRKGLMFMADWVKVNCTVVGEAADGEEGLEKIQSLSPDIVIADVKMPIKSGIQMLEESIDQYGYEAIIISGYSEFAYAKKAISLGVTEYLLKPVDFNQLYLAIQKIIEKLKANIKVEEYIRQMEQEPLFNPGILELETAGNKHVSDMMRYIKEQYPNRISLTDLSIQCDRSCTYLNSKFKTETGYTFNDFLNRYRILQAVNFLKTGEWKVYEIAQQVGFSDYKYFIKVFKKYTGCSPIKFVSQISGNVV